MTARGVLVVGDANPDLILAGDTVPRFGQAEQLLDSADLVIGGSAAIVACGLARLGIPTTLAAVVGDDSFGEFMTGRLADRGVDVSGIRIDPDRATGLTVVLLKREDRGILTLPGAIPELTADDVLDAVESGHPAHVHFASYYLQPRLAARLPALLDRLRHLGITTSIDTNWDPSETWQGMADVLPRVDLFFPNRDELIAIAKALGRAGDGSVEDAAGGLAELGPRVVVKVGAAGGVTIDAGTITREPGLTVDLVDTTGAGDSFDAGYLAALSMGLSTESDRLSWAACAGSLSVRGRGGTAAQATQDELERVAQRPA